MTDEDLPPTVRRRRRYKRLLLGILAVGVVALVGGLATGYGLAGSVVYLLAALTIVVLSVWLHYVAAFPFVDERDLRIERRASDLTVTVVAVVGLIVWPALIVLDQAGYEAFPPRIEALFFGWGAVFVLWGACYAYFRHRP